MCCGDSGTALKVSIAAKTSLLEPRHTFCLSPLAHSAHCCHVIFLLMTLDACVCPLLLMAALSSSSVVRSTTGWSPSLESLHLAASLIFPQQLCPRTCLSLCKGDGKSFLSHYLPPWHMLIWLITRNLHFDVKAQLPDSLVLLLTSEMSGRRRFVVTELNVVDDFWECWTASPRGGSRP